MADEKRKITIGREEQRRLIGTKVTEGSIVRVKDGNRVIHIVITDIDREWYEGAKIVLSAEPYNPDKEVLLVKGEDAIYRNSNYKVKVRVLAESITGLKYENFIQGAGGTIVGKVVKDATLQRICKNVHHEKSENSKNSNNFPEVESKTEETLSAKDVMKDSNQLPEGSMAKKELLTENCEVKEGLADAEPEDRTERHAEGSEENTGDSVAETEEDVEKENDVKMAIPGLDFEKVVSESKDVDELIYNLGLSEYQMLKEAIELAIEDRHGKIKKLLVTMHVHYPKLNQNAIRLIINQEFSEWIAVKNLQMIEFSVSYVLKTIAKGMR